MEALHNLQILDTEPEQAYDDITRLAARICDAPIALVSLVDQDRQWFKSRVGLGICATSREVSFCAYAIEQQDIFIVPDAAADPRFADSPLVIGNPYIRFYAGVPLVTEDGQAIGSLCVIDHQPRILSPAQQADLVALAHMVVAQITLRQRSYELSQHLAAKEKLLTEKDSLLAENANAAEALKRSERRSSAVLQAALDCIIAIDDQGLITEWNPAAEQTFGWTRAEALGRPHIELIVPERLRDAHERGMAHYRATSEGPILNLRIELPALRRDGSEFPVELTVCPITDGSGVAFTAFLRDLTAQKAAEERLRLLATAIENVGDVVVITEAEPISETGPRVIYVNEAFTHVTGYSQEEILGKTPRILQGPDTSRETCEFLRRKLKAWKPIDVELLNYRKDGTPFWSHLNIRPVADENGWYTHWVSVQRDVTGRHNAEEEERAAAGHREGALTQDLQEKEARFQGMVEGLGEGILITDFDDIVLYASPRLEEITGWTCGEMLGRPAYELLLSREDWPDLRAGNGRRSAGISECWEARLLHKNGTSFWAENKATPFRNAAGHIIGTLGAITDISEHKELEREKERLAAEREQLSQRMQLFLDSVGEGFFGIGLDGRTTFVNPAAAAMLGYTVDELIGMPMHDTLHHTHADGTHYPLQECPIYAALTDGAIHHITDEVFWRKDSSRFPVEYVSTPVREGGKLIGAVVTFRDITERRALEEGQKHLLAETEQMLAEALERADRDPLTGLLNHRAFHRRLEEEADRAQRAGGSLSVVILDVDNFKFFNDAYGHVAGDDVLRQLADALRLNCRSYDALARFGGDEFALILPGAEDARALAAGLSERLASIGYQPPGYDTVIPLGVTVGLASFPEEAASRGDVVALADMRLRRTKTGGGETEDLIASLRSRLPEAAVEGFLMLTALVTAVDAKDRYTRNHSEDVLTYSLQITKRLGLDERTQQTVALAALLHDVGKIGVPDSVLRKPGRLTDAEFAAIQQHPVMGAAIVGAVPGFEDMLDVIRHHHERWDGKGYPDGLKGEATPLIARLMAVADAYSAMTTDRPYRKGMTEGKALSILGAGAGTQWDPACVAAFRQARELNPFIPAPAQCQE